MQTLKLSAAKAELQSLQTIIFLSNFQQPACINKNTEADTTSKKKKIITKALSIPVNRNSSYS